VNTCKTCRRKDVDKINHLIVSGTPLRSITDDYGIPAGSIQRHKEQCIREMLVSAYHEQRQGLLGKLDRLEQKFELMYEDDRFRPAAGRLLVDLFDKEAKIAGAYQQDRKNETDLGKELAEKWGLPGEKIQEIAEKFEQ
jgi:hypothetical protein